MLRFKIEDHLPATPRLALTPDPFGRPARRLTAEAADTHFFVQPGQHCRLQSSCGRTQPIASADVMRRHRDQEVSRRWQQIVAFPSSATFGVSSESSSASDLTGLAVVLKAQVSGRSHSVRAAWDELAVTSKINTSPSMIVLYMVTHLV